jgi:hypothetical protein
MAFLEHQAKGLTRLLTDVDLPPERLRIHISEVGPGERSHPPHQHPGVEAFYMARARWRSARSASASRPARRSCSTQPNCMACSTAAMCRCATL